MAQRNLGSCRHFIRVADGIITPAGAFQMVERSLGGLLVVHALLGSRHQEHGRTNQQNPRYDQRRQKHLLDRFGNGAHGFMMNGRPCDRHKGRLGSGYGRRSGCRGHRSGLVHSDLHFVALEGALILQWIQRSCSKLELTGGRQHCITGQCAAFSYLEAFKGVQIHIAVRDLHIGGIHLTVIGNSNGKADSRRIIIDLGAIRNSSKGQVKSILWIHGGQ